jgi:S-DNA-T family DNA segregation ATPase FtsK/SpoIIIE
MALISWSPLDPSYLHTTWSHARNWLGTPGAIVSDLLIQSFAVAALAVLLAPMFWGLALVQREPIPALALRCVGYLASVLCLAAAAAGAPTPLAWPLHPGAGGIVGDTILQLVVLPVPAAHAGFARPIAALACGLLGFLAAALSIGATGTTKRRSPLDVTAKSTARHSARPSMSAVSPPEPQLTMSAQPPRPARSVPPRVHTQYGPYAGFDLDQDMGPIDLDLDAETEATSRGMAWRFAPQSMTAVDGGHSDWQQEPNPTHALQASVSEAFEAQAPWPTEPVAAVAVRQSTGRDLTTRDAYKRPSLNLLERPVTSRTKSVATASMLRGNARLLEDVLADFGVHGDVCDIEPGPVVTLYAYRPQPGTKIARVISLADDVARQMGVPGLRIFERAMGTPLAIEMPNQVRQPVFLRDVLDAETYRSTRSVLPIALGHTAAGEPVVADLALMPHLLVAGAAETGKSTGINAMILSLIYKHGPDDCRFLMIDPKMLDLAVYNGIPHLLTPIVSDPHKALTALSWCVTEMEERAKRMAAIGVRTIDVFNNRVRNAKKRGERLARTVQTGFHRTTGEATYVKEEMNLETLPYIIIVVDEIAELMAVAGRDVEGAVQRLAEAARAVGIHMIVSTGRPTPDIVTQAIQDAFSGRLSFKAGSKAESRAVVGDESAAQLLGSGDMLYASETGGLLRVQGAYVSGTEVESVAVALRQHGAPEYHAVLMDEMSRTPSARSHAASNADDIHRSGLAATSDDALYDRAVAIIARETKVTVTLLQRRLAISAGWAIALLRRLEADGVVGPPSADGCHPVLLGRAA